MSTSGLMMNRPLLISGILEHAAAQFGEQEIVSRETHGPLHRSTFAQAAKRSRQLANALAQMGLKAGSAVGSIAWNNHRHLEAYYAVSGSGMVMHTCNPRLHPQQLIYVINHAEDEVVLFDATFAPLVKGIAAHCPQVRAWVCLADAANTPTIEGVANVMNYEGLITGHSDRFDWPEFDENTGAALCYTSGTTGNPKGVLYTHRAIVLNATMACLPDVLSLSTQETILPVVPMFHINAWCIPYAALVAGTKLVLPGPKLDGPSLYELMDTEQVTISAGVPTIWMGLIQHAEQNNLRFAHMKRTCVGGSAMPMALIAKFMDNYGVEVRHGWGMTETTAIATMSVLGAADAELPPEDRHALVAKQGKSVFGIELKLVDENGASLPRDGVAQGTQFRVDSPLATHAVERLEGDRYAIAMGVPQFDPTEVPLAGFVACQDSYSLAAYGEQVEVGAVSMGNPHAVFFVEDVNAYDIPKIGPLVENHPLFPQGTNVGFAQVIDKQTIRLRVWERGAGLTKACGTGACAAVVCAARAKLTGRKVRVIVDGGDLHIEWRESDDHVYMTGPVELEFETDV